MVSVLALRLGRAERRDKHHLNRASSLTSEKRNCANQRITVTGLSVPRIEGEQLGVNQDEGVQHLLSCSPYAAIELLNQTALQELNALFT